MKQIRVAISDNWKLGLTMAGILLLLVISYAYRLVSLTKGMDNYELRIVTTISTHGTSPLSLVRESLWLPHDLYMFALQYLPLGDSVLFWSRFFGVGLAIGAIGSMYYVLSRWHSSRLALIAVVSFAYSSWLLMVGRYAFPVILYVLPLIALAGWTAMRSGYRKLGLAITASATLASVYVPGLIWLVAAAIILQRKQIARFLRAVPQAFMFSLLAIGVVGLIPLITSIVWPPIATDPLHATLLFAGLPTDIVSMGDYAHGVGRLLQSLFLRQEYASTMSVGLAPLVSFMTTITLLLGVVELVHNRYLDRSKILLAWLIIGFVLAALGGVSEAVLLPIVYIISAQGLWYLLDMWLRTFPRNPVARNVGLGLVMGAITVSVGYNITSYFLAWPHTTRILTEFIH